MRKVVRRKDDEWRTLIRLFQESCLSISKWCDQEGISITTFRRKLALFSADKESKSAVVVAEERCNCSVSAETNSNVEATAEKNEHEQFLTRPLATTFIGLVEETKARPEAATELKNSIPENAIVEVGQEDVELLPEIGKMSDECKIIYFVDTENVNGDPIGILLRRMDDASKMLIFYTEKSPHISYDVLTAFMDKCKQISRIPCGRGTDNALDFQLVSALGYVIMQCLCTSPDFTTKEFVIVSNDHGFDAVVSFWKSRGVLIKRLPVSGIIPENTKPEVLGAGRVKDAYTPRLLESKQDDVSNYYISHTSYQKEMQVELSCRLGEDFKKRGIKISDKTRLMDMILKTPTPTKTDFSVVCTTEVAALLTQIPAQIYTERRIALYNNMLKKHPT